MARKKKNIEIVSSLDEELSGPIEIIENDIEKFIERSELVDTGTVVSQLSENSNHLYRVNDPVIWEGVVCLDSYGNGQTKEHFSPRKGVIDLINNNKFGLHIKGIGWVGIDAVKKV